MDNMVNSVLCIVQSRLTSTRLPNKVLMPLGQSNKTIVEHICERMAMSPCINKTIFAIPDTAQNDALYDFLTQHSIPVYRGSEDDVLARFYHCLQENPADIIVRATCDNPLVDWQHIQPMIQILTEQQCDYVSGKGFSLGTCVEVCSATALKKAYKEATTSAEHEHVMPYLYLHPDLFKLGVYENENKSHRSFRLTVDCPEDYELMNCIYNALHKGKPIPTEEAVRFLEAHPEIAGINQNIQQKTI